MTTTTARRPAAAGPGAHRTDNGPTVQLTRETLRVIVGRSDVGRHHAPGRWEESFIPPLLLIGFGLLLILTGALWW